MLNPKPRLLKSHVAFVLILLALVLLAIEAYRAYGFYRDVSESKDILLSIRDELDITELEDSEDGILVKRERLVRAAERLGAARAFVRTDPLITLGSLLPVAGDQVDGLKLLVAAAEESARTGVQATDVALAFARYERDPGRTSIEEAIGFLKGQEPAMAEVEAGLQRLQSIRRQVPGGLYGPLDRATTDLDTALARLEALVDGYNRAIGLLPELLGQAGPRRYLVLPQNNTELFPSGGLISSYGIVTFDGGRLVSMDLEYFGTLFDRWQSQTHEYIEPPAPLKNYLKYDYSWGLGEAGWYPDFPTTARLAAGFVAKGGAPPTDGIIAIDLKFVRALLELLGPVSVPDYGVTVTAENVEEVTLEQTRDEDYVPGTPRKAFLSHLARAVLTLIFTSPKDQWVDLLSLLDRMGRERHLQLNFNDANLQSLARGYSFDGALTKTDGDALLIADSSVNSTKLNLILQTRARLDLQLFSDGSVRSLLTYTIMNPLPEWRIGRDPRLVQTLMLDGVYGCYLRLYVHEQARLLDVRLQGRSVGPEQVDLELGRRVFGRFFPVLPGATASVQFLYETPGVAQQGEDGLYHYNLYVQKQAGTDAVPLDVHAVFDKGVRLTSISLDGNPASGASLQTDLRIDREIEIVFSGAPRE
ncbi:MAG: DUF4012 domain-containing protein [Dehalococcoidia bacterium]|nr:DUF4012 domain-containing protein [Dehalococcoidia bacterium]